VPGAFTPTCSLQAPGYIEKYDEFKAKGVTDIYILTVNDVFVTKYVCMRVQSFAAHKIFPPSSLFLFACVP
jgi:peroxiredoxin